MPLRQGSSDKVVQENIKCILDKDGCGYDPPYLDPARDEYTPAQAAAIAYAKAGRRNNVGKKTSTSKKTKSVKTQEVKTPEGKKDEPKGDKSTSPAQSAKKEKDTDTKNPANNIQIPDGWKTQQPGGDIDNSKKNQPLEGTKEGAPKPQGDQKAPEPPSSAGDDYEKLYQDNKDLLEKAYGGNGIDVKGGVWDILEDKMKQYMLDTAPKIIAEKEKNKKAKAPAPAPAPKDGNNSGGGDAGSDDNKMLQDILDSPDVNDAYKKAIKNQWKNSTPEEQKAIYDQYVKNIKPAPAPAPEPPAQSQQSTPSSAPTEDKYEKLYQDNKDLLEEAYATEGTDVKNVWDLVGDSSKQYMLDAAPKIIEEKKKKQASQQTSPQPQPQPTDVNTPQDWNWDPNNYGPQLKGDQLYFQGKTYKESGTLPGSTAPKLYVDEDGKPKFVVKDNGGNVDQTNSEYIANRVYNELAQHMPIGASTSRFADGKLVNSFIQDGKTLKQLSPQELVDNKVYSSIRKSMLADALLANWDFIGLDRDNIMMDKSGNLIKIDAGGTFNFRAQGDNKNYNALPMEMWSLKDDKNGQGNPYWKNAIDDDYKHLWTDQISQLYVHSSSLKNIVNKSNLDDNVKAAFGKRVDSLIIAKNEIDNFANKSGDPESWKDVDQALKAAFEKSQGIDPNSPDWESELRKNIASELSTVKTKASNSVFNQSNKYFDKYQYEDSVHSVTTDAEKIPGGEPFKTATDDQKYSIHSYTGSAYEDLNRYLNFGITNGPEQSEHHDVMADAIESLLDTLPPDTNMLYRMNAVPDEFADSQQVIKNLKVGDVIATAGFDSYTRYDNGVVMRQFAQGPQHFHYVSVYQGNQAKDVDPISMCRGEKESLLQRGSNIKVVKIEEVPLSKFPSLDPNMMPDTQRSGMIKVITYGDA